MLTVGVRVDGMRRRGGLRKTSLRLGTIPGVTTKPSLFLSFLGHSLVPGTSGLLIGSADSHGRFGKIFVIFPRLPHPGIYLFIDNPAAFTMTSGEWGMIPRNLTLARDMMILLHDNHTKQTTERLDSP